ncbi:hypothetical protein ACVFI8_10570 [Agarivorans sp. MS3-6]|nr:hypothetical protein [Agarivorans sp. TSD2052]
MAVISLGSRILLLVVMLGSVFIYPHATPSSWAMQCTATSHNVS